jgi:hypothetical protein
MLFVTAQETDLTFDDEMKRLSAELHHTLDDLNRGDVESALK